MEFTATFLGTGLPRPGPVYTPPMPTETSPVYTQVLSTGLSTPPCLQGPCALYTPPPSKKSRVLLREDRSTASTPVSTGVYGTVGLLSINANPMLVG